MWAIILKEFRQLKRDRRTVAMLFMLPLFFLVVFGYAASFDVKTVPTIVVGPRAQIAAAHVTAKLRVVPATLEERFVALARSSGYAQQDHNERTAS